MSTLIDFHNIIKTNCHLQVQTGSGLEDTTCAICIQDYEPKDIYNITRCYHTFHKSCITEWIRRNNSCPLCKQNIIFIGINKIYTNKKDFTNSVKTLKLVYIINNTYNDRIVITDEITDIITMILREKIYKTFSKEFTHNFFGTIYSKIISNELKLATDVETLLIKKTRFFQNISNIIKNKPYLIQYVTSRLIKEEIFHDFIYHHSDIMQYLNIYQIIVLVSDKKFNKDLFITLKMFRFKLIETLEEAYKMNPIKFIKTLDSYKNYDKYKHQPYLKQAYDFMLKYAKKNFVRNSDLKEVFKLIGNNIELFLDYFTDIIDHNYFWNVFRFINNIEIIDVFLKIDPTLINSIKYDLLKQELVIKYLIRNFSMLHLMNELPLDILLESLLQLNEIKEVKNINNSNNNLENNYINISNYSIDKIIDILISKNSDISDKMYILSRPYLLLYIIKKYPATLNNLPNEFITVKIKSYISKKKPIILEKKINYIVNDEKFKEDLNKDLITYPELKLRLKYVSTKLLNDDNIAFKIVANIIDDLDKILYDHFFSSRKSFILACSKIDGKKTLSFLKKTHNRTFITDPDIVTSAINQDPDAIKYL